MKAVPAGTASGRFVRRVLRGFLSDIEAILQQVSHQDVPSCVFCGIFSVRMVTEQRTGSPA